MNVQTPLSRAVTQAAVSLPMVATETLARYLSVTTKPTLAGAQALLSTPNFKDACSEIWAAWEGTDLPATALSVALLSSATAVEVERRKERVDLVATGPSSYVVPVRSTESVLLDLVANAEQSLLLLSFAAYKVEALVAELAAAVDRGVVVRLLLETTASGNLTMSASDAFSSLEGQVSFLQWHLESRPLIHEHYATMHAKAVVADSSTAFITSANFTGTALEQNLELGVLISGGHLPAQLERHIESLIASGIVGPL